MKTTYLFIITGILIILVMFFNKPKPVDPVKVKIDSVKYDYDGHILVNHSEITINSLKH